MELVASAHRMMVVVVMLAVGITVVVVVVVGGRGGGMGSVSPQSNIISVCSFPPYSNTSADGRDSPC